METATHTESHLVYPEPIGNDRIEFLKEQKKIDGSIAEIDLEMVKMKLQDKEEGKGWSKEQCESAEIEYKRYWNLCLEFGRGIVPNQIMDVMWHYHILDTKAYHIDCEKIFEGYMHHYPYFGMRGKEDAQDLKDSFYKTKELYLKLFGEEMVREEHDSCWHDCENRCWHACPEGK